MGHENQASFGTSTAFGTARVINDVEMKLTVSSETFNKIQHLAEEIHGTRDEVFARALALFDLAVDKRNAGLRLAFVDADDHVATEVTGI